MITLKLDRYYGTPNITKSHLTVTDDGGKVLMKCEAREGRYVDYDGKKKMPGSSLFCLGRGEYHLKPDHCAGNPMCLRIYGDARRRGFFIMVGSDERDQFKLMAVQLGRGTLAEPKRRRITDFVAMKEELRQMIYANYLDEFRLVVSNEGVEVAGE